MIEGHRVVANMTYHMRSIRGRRGYRIGSTVITSATSNVNTAKAIRITTTITNDSNASSRRLYIYYIHIYSK